MTKEKMIIGALVLPRSALPRPRRRKLSLHLTSTAARPSGALSSPSSGACSRSISI